MRQRAAATAACLRAGVRLSGVWWRMECAICMHRACTWWRAAPEAPWHGMACHVVLCYGSRQQAARQWPAGAYMYAWQPAPGVEAGGKCQAQSGRGGAGQGRALPYLALDALQAVLGERAQKLAHDAAALWVLPCPLELKRLDLQARPAGKHAQHMPCGTGTGACFLSWASSTAWAHGMELGGHHVTQCYRDTSSWSKTRASRVRSQLRSDLGWEAVQDEGHVPWPEPACRKMPGRW